MAAKEGSLRPGPTVLALAACATLLLLLCLPDDAQAGETSGYQYHSDDPLNFWSSLSSNPVQTYSFKSDFYGHRRDNAAASLAPVLLLSLGGALPGLL